MQALPANPNLDWLRKAAKRQLSELRAAQPEARRHHNQHEIANAYGFKNWRALKAHVDGINLGHERDRVFAAARAGDIEAVRRAIGSGFDPATPDADGRTLHQVAIELRSRRSSCWCAMPKRAPRVRRTRPKRSAAY